MLRIFSGWLMLWAMFWGSSCSRASVAPNFPPIASVSCDREILKDQITHLDGSSSYDPNGDELIFSWRILSRPISGTAQLSSNRGNAVDLQPDALGVWIVNLTVSDGRLESIPAVVQILVVKRSCEGIEDCENNDLWCDGISTCEEGECIFSIPDCDDLDPCTQNLCNDDQDKCDNPPVTSPPGEEGLDFPGTCDDNLDNDCDQATDAADTACVAECSSPEECNDQNPCTQDSCGADQRCHSDMVSNDTSCEEFFFCSFEDKCQDGECISGDAIDCSGSSDECNQGTCNEEQDRCEPLPLENGTNCQSPVCQDTDLVQPICQEGVCDGTKLIDNCKKNEDPCDGEESCDPANGCVPGTALENNTPCELPPGPNVAPCQFYCQNKVCQKPVGAGGAFCDSTNLSLVGCYTFDNDGDVGAPQGVKDGSQYGNHGTGDNIAYAQGHSGLCISLNAQGGIAVPSSTSLDQVQALTVEAWIRPQIVPTYGQRMGILDNDGQYGLFILDDGKVHCTAGGYVVNGDDVPLGVWTHIACTVHNRDKMRFYQNGILKVEIDYPTDINTDNTNIVAIGSNSPLGDTFVGEIDSVRVWNIVRSADEICWDNIAPE